MQNIDIQTSKKIRLIITNDFPPIIRGISKVFYHLCKRMPQTKSLTTFESMIKTYTHQKYCFFTNSGTTAFYIILKALKRISNKKEVILPAYTAPSLILPIRKAGLKPVLCDISLKTFNMDIEELQKCINTNTLCIVPVHMFGRPIDMESIKEIARPHSVFIVEDAASSLGTTINEQPTGTLGDAGFYSFNIGKNLSTLSGGCIVTDREDLAEAIVPEHASLLQPGMISKLKIAVKLIVQTFAVRPLFYTLFYDLISKPKYTIPPTDFDTFRYTRIQAGMGLALFRHAVKIFNKRYDHGMFLLEMLGKLKGIRTPELLPDTFPVFNQYPLFFDNEGIKECCFSEINKAGIECIKRYPDPIHRIYDLGYDLNKDPFPNATYFAKRLLLIPVHPLMNIEKLSLIVNMIKGSLGM
jgi:perosamine synthetase